MADLYRRFFARLAITVLFSFEIAIASSFLPVASNSNKHKRGCEQMDAAVNNNKNNNKVRSSTAKVDTGPFLFVADPHVARVLGLASADSIHDASAPPSAVKQEDMVGDTSPPLFLDVDSFQIQWRKANLWSNKTGKTLQMQDLVPLAEQCDEVLFGKTNQVFEREGHRDPLSKKARSFLSPRQVWLAEVVTMSVPLSSPEQGEGLNRGPTEGIGSTGLALEGIQETNNYPECCDAPDSSCWTVFALLLGLNRLESSLRLVCATKAEAGRAPLLKDMISQIAALDLEKSLYPVAAAAETTASADNHAPPGNMDESLADAITNETYTCSAVGFVLQCLLLPTGLNLRNLIWHGFVAGPLPRCWLSLVLVLTENMEAIARRRRQECELLQINNNTTTLDNSKKEDSSGRIKLDPFAKPKGSTLPGVPLQSEYPLLSDVVQRGKLVRQTLVYSSSCSISQWLPPSHTNLWKLAVLWMQNNDQQDTTASSPTASSYPACICALLTVLLEHALRLDWCRVNNRPMDVQAHPGRFYVTLDGHGQRHKHDVLLLPFVSLSGDDHWLEVVQQKPNQLVEYLGGNCIALLTDLYASSCGGPNIRAALAHGLWDDSLDSELASMAQNAARAAVTTTSIQQQGGPCDEQSPPPPVVPGNSNDSCSSLETKKPARSPLLWDMVDSILCVMEECASISVLKRTEKIIVDQEGARGLQQQQRLNPRLYHRPLFSYTATTVRSLESVELILQQLSQDCNSHALLNPETAAAGLVDIPDSIVTKLSVPFTALQSKICTVIKVLSQHEDGMTNRTIVTGEGWTAKNVFAEHESNLRLVECTAARSLLEDISVAASSFRNEMRVAVELLQTDDDESSSTNWMRSRQRRKLMRTIACSPAALNVYSFATTVALLSLANALKDLQQLDVETRLSDTDYLKAVERTRMVVSTFSTFLTANVDRAFKSADEFARGKAMRQVITDIDYLFSPHKT